MKKTLVAIDGYSLLHRAYFAMPALTAPDASPTGALTGFLNMFLSTLEKAQPDYVLVAFDVKGGTFRNEMYDAYKANRPPMPDDLRVQVDLLRDVLGDFGIACVQAQGYEADDVLGTYAQYCQQQDVQAILVTGDRDSFQLISPTTCVWMTRKGISQIDVFDEEKLLETYGLTPARIVDLKALMGDASDNIPGVPKVGEKTALKLLQKYGTLENTLAHADEAGGPKLCENLRNYAQQARLSYQLAKICRDVPGLCADLEQFAFAWPAVSSVQARLEKLGLRGVLQKVRSHAPQQQEESEVSVAPAPALVRVEQLHTLQQVTDVAARMIEKQMPVAVWMNETVLTLSQDAQVQYNVQLAMDLFCEDAVALQALIKALQPLFEADVPKVLYDVKAWKQRLDGFQVSLQHADFDVLLAAYVLDATVSSYPLERLREQYLETPCEAGAALLLQLRKAMMQKMQQEKTDTLFQQIEMPLIDVLYDMQRSGFHVDTQALRQIGRELSEKIDTLAQRIYQAAGEQFNINSPKQLGTILFEKMKLPVLKKTKSGYSTDADVLEQLAPQSPMIVDILAYRQAAKLKGTYVDGMLPLIDHNDRIHTTFNQTVTATGRISSSEPNLQNIPVRTPLGRTLRRIFSSDGPDRLLVDADYSQIELRVLAHLSQDETMCEAFDKGLDIHSDTASKMWHVPLAQVTQQMRAAAKAINFGIVYGISDFGLSRNIGISRAEAADFIKRYRQTYSGVTQYMEQLVQSAKDLGYAQTMFGRRRALPQLQSGNYNMRNFGARVAMNMPIQGSAADIIKLAMIRVHEKLDGKRAKLILQVHDELIVDCEQSLAEDVMQIVCDAMRNVVSMRVPLVVDAKTGKTWYEAK
jgi:DNA polymerase-1